MEYLKDILIPNQMYPELAYHLARMLVWDNSDDREIDFVALCFLRATWDAGEPQTLPNIVARLFTLSQDGDGPAILKRLSDEAHYEAQAKTRGAGTLTLHHVNRAVRTAASHIPVEKVTDYMLGTAKAMSAAIEDVTSRTANLARLATEAIATMMPTDAELAASGDRVEPTEAGVMVQTPVGAFGPFPTVRDAIAWRQRAMAASSQGLPLPPIAPMHGQLESKETSSNAAVPVGPTAVVYSQAEAVKMLERIPPPSMPGEGNSQHVRMLEMMARGNGSRAMTVLTDLEPLKAMRSQFPHFQAVLDFVETRLALSGCGDTQGLVQVPPILLRGVEGTGKSFFAKTLARALGAHFVARDLGTTSALSVLSGMDSSYKGSKPGIVFDALINGPTANPVIYLNEIDKATGTGSLGNPMNALFTLMEPEDSQLFTDDFIPIPIDASRVIWICTANDGALPTPILQRLEVFDIKAPTAEHCRAIAASVWGNVCSTSMPKGHGFSTELPASLLDVMSAVPPRVMRKALEHAAGTAVAKGNRHLLASDVTASQKRYEAQAPRQMGF